MLSERLFNILRFYSLSRVQIEKKKKIGYPANVNPRSSPTSRWPQGTSARQHGSSPRRCRGRLQPRPVISACLNAKTGNAMACGKSSLDRRNDFHKNAIQSKDCIIIRKISENSFEKRFRMVYIAYTKQNDLLISFRNNRKTPSVFTIQKRL